CRVFLTVYFSHISFFFFFQAEDGIRDFHVTGVQTCALPISVGDEGGFAPDMASNAEALETLTRAIEAAGYRPGEQISLALDVAASEFYDKSKKIYRLAGEGGRELDAAGMADLYAELAAKYPLISIEDGLDENVWDGWKLLTEKLGAKVQLVG